MRGSDAVSGSLFSYVDLEDRVPAKHPLRLVRGIVNEVLLALDADFSAKLTHARYYLGAHKIHEIFLVNVQVVVFNKLGLN